MRTFKTMISWHLPRGLTAFCLGFLMLLEAGRCVLGYSFNGYSWPSGTQIVMHLQLSRAYDSPLQDGSASWNASAADALTIWNQYLGGVSFVEAAPAGPSGGDGMNSVFFSSNVYGDSWPSHALAVTITYSEGASTVTTETDVLFNTAIKWNSYRGPIQGSGATGTYDLHRVALHEFGHVLGLDHPDQHGQYVTALMNSIISDLDHLSDDDIAGARSLYALRLTSSLNPPAVRSGDDFSYKITANNNPSGYSATGLPAGLQLDPATGLISGRCPTSGTFPVDVTAQGTVGTATGRIQVVITPLPITSSGYAQVQVGDNFSYQISAQNNPTSFDATGLPAGLAVNSGTGLISGAPQASGTFGVRVFARSTTSEAAANLNLVVTGPRITSGYPPPVELGDPLSYQVTATNNPTSFSASGLPPGLQINPGTGVISGTATAAGYYSVTITAQTAYGPATGIIAINILAPHITSSPNLPTQDVGSNFDYQITASNHPYYFTATGLPAGLQIDSNTGKITGVAELSGLYQVTVTAQGNTGTATATVTILVQPVDVADPPLKKLSPSYISGSIVADPARPRLYVATGSGVAVVDTESLTILQNVSVPSSFGDLSISADGSKLWVTAYYDAKIRAVDLNTLTVSTTITTTLYPKFIREGADGRLYVTDYNRTDVFQLDAGTGAVLSQFSPRGTVNTSACAIETSPDRKTLYVLCLTNYSPLGSYSLSDGAPPVLVQRVESTNSQSYATRLAAAPSGGSVSVVSRNYNFQTIDPTLMRSTSDLNVVQGSVTSASFATDVAYNLDGSLLFQAVSRRSRIDVFQTNSSQLARTITLPDRAVPGDDLSATRNFAVDRTNNYLFVASHNYPSPGLYVYSLVPPPKPQTPPKSLLNVATRMRAQPGDDALIGGFIVNGQGPKQLALRAIGPSLPVPGKLADPVLQLYDSTGALIAQNDNWNAHRAEVITTGLPPLDEHEAVIATTLPPGSYTAVVRGVNNASGVALVEVYDLSANSTSKLANISTRGKVEAGDNVMIGGFILGGDQVTSVVVRAIGPSLSNFGVNGALTDPKLEVYDGNGTLLAQDDDWRMYQEAQLIQTGLAPTDDREAAMLLFLQPGAYTAIVRGKNDTAGIGLVEVYNLDAK
jgi:hypothetical protein